MIVLQPHSLDGIQSTKSTKDKKKNCSEVESSNNNKSESRDKDQQVHKSRGRKRLGENVTVSATVNFLQVNYYLLILLKNFLFFFYRFLWKNNFYFSRKRQKKYRIVLKFNFSFTWNLLELIKLLFFFFQRESKKKRLNSILLNLLDRMPNKNEPLDVSNILERNRRNRKRPGILNPWYWVNIDILHLDT